MRASNLFGGLLVLSLVACGEMGSDPNGPNAALLVLRDDAGRTREFYLGGYDSVADCESVLKTEVDAAAERGNQFWTNPEFDYGGVAQEGWIRHSVVGARCGVNPPSKSADAAGSPQT